ncbi:HNH endonuclease [Bradyrhizobium elkanii]|uniref:HNH endonuclease n=1 Tax=Bradyrhizobium elkanii TaxID=29448 RepID=UPI0004853DCA|nr:HNH endonuclease [Bradyrhizobium elkanii]
MISLRKSAEPSILAANKERWTQELLGGNDDALVKRKYALGPIKAAIIEETNGKCAFCESKLLHIAYGDVEHITPKKWEKALAFEWFNLTLACDVCNTNKGTKTDIFDPYSDDPSSHFWFVGPFIFATPTASLAAEISLVALDLNRANLVERRGERIKNLERNLKVIVNCPQVELRKVLSEALLKNESDASKEFCACSRAFLDDPRVAAMM